MKNVMVVKIDWKWQEKVCKNIKTDQKFEKNYWKILNRLTKIVKGGKNSPKTINC